MPGTGASCVYAGTVPGDEPLGPQAPAEDGAAAEAPPCTIHNLACSIAHTFLSPSSNCAVFDLRCSTQAFTAKGPHRCEWIVTERIGDRHGGLRAASLMPAWCPEVVTSDLKRSLCCRHWNRNQDRCSALKVAKSGRIHYWKMTQDAREVHAAYLCWKVHGCYSRVQGLCRGIEEAAVQTTGTLTI